MPSFSDAHSTQSIWKRLNATSELLARVEEVHNDDGDDECIDDEDDGNDHHAHHDTKDKAKHNQEESEDEDRKGKGKDKVEQPATNNEAESEEEEEAGTDAVELFPPFEGFGLFPIAAMMNVRLVHT
jgi:hypothetical protein